MEKFDDILSSLDKEERSEKLVKVSSANKKLLNLKQFSKPKSTKQETLTLAKVAFPTQMLSDIPALTVDIEQIAANLAQPFSKIAKLAIFNYRNYGLIGVKAFLKRYEKTSKKNVTFFMDKDEKFTELYADFIYCVENESFEKQQAHSLFRYFQRYSCESSLNQLGIKEYKPKFLFTRDYPNFKAMYAKLKEKVYEQYRTVQNRAEPHHDNYIDYLHLAENSISLSQAERATSIIRDRFDIQLANSIKESSITVNPLFSEFIDENVHIHNFDQYDKKSSKGTKAGSYLAYSVDIKHMIDSQKPYRERFPCCEALSELQIESNISPLPTQKEGYWYKYIIPLVKANKLMQIISIRKKATIKTFNNEGISTVKTLHMKGMKVSAETIESLNKTYAIPQLYMRKWVVVKTNLHEAQIAKITEGNFARIGYDKTNYAQHLREFNYLDMPILGINSRLWRGKEISEQKLRSELYEVRNTKAKKQENQAILNSLNGMSEFQILHERMYNEIRSLSEKGALIKRELRKTHDYVPRLRVEDQRVKTSDDSLYLNGAKSADFGFSRNNISDKHFTASKMENTIFMESKFREDLPRLRYLHTYGLDGFKVNVLKSMLGLKMNGKFLRPQAASSLRSLLIKCFTQHLKHYYVEGRQEAEFILCKLLTFKTVSIFRLLKWLSFFNNQGLIRFRTEFFVLKNYSQEAFSAAEKLLLTFKSYSHVKLRYAYSEYSHSLLITYQHLSLNPYSNEIINNSVKMKGIRAYLEVIAKKHKLVKERKQKAEKVSKSAKYEGLKFRTRSKNTLYKNLLAKHKIWNSYLVYCNQKIADIDYINVQLLAKIAKYREQLTNLVDDEGLLTYQIIEYLNMKFNTNYAFISKYSFIYLKVVPIVAHLTNQIKRLRNSCKDKAIDVLIIKRLKDLSKHK